MPEFLPDVQRWVKHVLPVSHPQKSNLDRLFTSLKLPALRTTWAASALRIQAQGLLGAFTRFFSISPSPRRPWR